MAEDGVVTTRHDNAAYLKALRLEAVARGDCYTCRCRPAKPGRRNCQHCIDEASRYWKATQAKRRKARRCPDCGGKPVRGKVMCRSCADRATMSRRAVVARGGCSLCHRDRGSDGADTVCRACADRMIKRARTRYRAKIAAGLCCRDGCAALLASASLCFGHLLEMRRTSRARTAAKRAA